MIWFSLVAKYFITSNGRSLFYCLSYPILQKLYAGRSARLSEAPVPVFSPFPSDLASCDPIPIEAPLIPHSFCSSSRLLSAGAPLTPEKRSARTIILKVKARPFLLRGASPREGEAFDSSPAETEGHIPSRYIPGTMQAGRSPPRRDFPAKARWMSS